MNKSELIDAITIFAATRAVILPKKSTMAVIDSMIDVISSELRRGGEVRVTGLGRFTTARREATTKKNPRTREPVDVAAKTVVKFKPEKGLREAVDIPQRKVGGQRISPMEADQRA